MSFSYKDLEKLENKGRHGGDKPLDFSMPSPNQRVHSSATNDKPAPHGIGLLHQQQVRKYSKQVLHSTTFLVLWSMVRNNIATTNH